MLNKELEKIEDITGIEEFYDTNILMDTDDKLPDDVTFKNVVILMICVIKDNDKFYPQIFLKKSLYV